MEPEFEVAFSAFAISMLIALLFVQLLVWAYLCVVWWKLFVKAGQPGWAAIVPFYNVIVYLEIIGKPWWWLLLMLIPYVNIVFIVWSFNLLSKSFGKNEWFTVGLVFAGVVFVSILAFGSSRYKGPAGAIPQFHTDRTN